MTREQAAQLIQHHLPAQSAALIQTLQPSIRLTVSQSGNDSTTSSKFGGATFLPPRMPWPDWDPSGMYQAQIELRKRIIAERRESWESKVGQAAQRRIQQLEAKIARHERMPLSLLAQIVLSELPSPSAVGLPQRGVLLFFYDMLSAPWGFNPTDRGAAQVVYLPDESSPRQLLPKPASLEKINLPPAQLQFTEEWTIEDVDPGAEPGVDMHQTNASRFSNEEESPTHPVTPYHQLLGELYGVQKRIHRIGGHPQTIQGEMRLELQMVTNGIPCGNPAAYQDPRVPALRAGADDWRLLLQLDSDDQRWSWGDLGRLYFWIRRDDLANRNFDRIWCALQCS